MSRQATRQVTYYSDGKPVTKVVDKETAQDIGLYNNVYHQIASYDIKSCTLPSKLDYFVREVLQAQTQRLRIVSIKEYIPNVPEELDSAHYQCGVLNKKTQEYRSISGTVAMLFFKLFNEQKSNRNR